MDDGFEGGIGADKDSKYMFVHGLFQHAVIPDERIK